MGNTILQMMVPGIEGQMLFESFEGTNWQSDQEWSVINGNPQASSDAPYIGTKSFKLDDGTWPLIEFDGTGTPQLNFRWAVCYFQDDATVITGTFTPFMLVEGAAAGGFDAGIGVDLSVSTGFYCKRSAGVNTATAIARTNGYHQFAIHNSGGILTAYIDGVSVGVVTPDSLELRSLRLGEITGSGTPGWGYFDNVQLATERDIVVNNVPDGALVTLMDEDHVSIASATAAAGAATLSVGFNNSPFVALIKTTKADGVQGQLQSGLQEIFAGDAFRQHIIDFGRRVDSFDYPPVVKRNDNESNSGVNETIFFNARNSPKISVPHITDSQRRELLGWWGFAQRANVYGVAIDSDKLLNVRVSSSTAKQGVVSIVQTPNTEFAIGQKLIIRHPDNLFWESIEIIGLGTMPNSIQLKDPLIHTYPTGSFIREEFYWPQVITLDKKLGISLSNTRLKRWHFTNTFKEEL